MRNQEGLPDEPIEYLYLLRKSFEGYRQVSSHEEYVSMMGKEKLLDVSKFPQYRMMEAADPLPEGFESRIYHFKDQSYAGGVVDVVFRDDELTNIRAQLFFKGFFPMMKAKKYLKNIMLPEFKLIFGDLYDSNLNNYYFKSSGIIGVACYVPRTPSVSFYLMDEEYA
jgi:hypothetical protein